MPMLIDSEKRKLEQVVARRWPDADVDRIDTVAGDASLRRYFRIFFKAENPEASIVAMLFDSVACAEVSGQTSIASDQAYVELSEFFASSAVAVPELYVDALDVSVLLIEDLGDRQLATVFESEDPHRVDDYYRNAIDEIIKIQRIPHQKDFFAFSRSFTRELYLAEMAEFRDYLFLKKTSDAQARVILQNMFSQICDHLEDSAQVLAHRDFHSWNLLVDSDNRVRVIDFQDALLAPVAYDMVALLNDRDSDLLIGKERYQMLCAYFMESLGLTKEFLTDYAFSLLQRDLKVAGRFVKLSQERGLVQYERWVPGTMKRIGRTLAWLAKFHKPSVANLELLASLFAEIEQGANEEAWFGI